MKKYIQLEKKSKKMQREYHKKQRKDWGGISPVTRCPDNRRHTTEQNQSVTVIVAVTLYISRP